MPPTTYPNDPFSSARLIYRPVRIPDDLPLFTAINNDQTGYINSNISNIKQPSASDAETFQKGVAESFFGCVIWLPTSTTRTPSNKDEKEHENENEKENTNNEIIPIQPIPNSHLSGTPIGQIHLKRPSSPSLAHHRNCELTLDILPSHQSHGYGSEAIRFMLDYAFRRAGLHRVRIRAFGWNEGAIRLYERLGFKEEGREREGLWHEGRWWDGVEMGILEGEWWLQREGEGKGK